MPSRWNRWDIVFVTKYPEEIDCKGCRRPLSITNEKCTHCGAITNVSSIVAKPRPALLWIDRANWRENITFAIPLSTTRLAEDDHQHIIKIEHCTFSNPDIKYQVPMRAMIYQSSRVDGNVLREKKRIGVLTDTSVRNAIENKLLSWIFG